MITRKNETKASGSFINRLRQPDIQLYRKVVQYLFLATVGLIGIKFTIFVSQLESGTLPTVTRPPGIEAFLPISSLISLKYWLVTGIINPIHPSGLIILLMALVTAVLLKRGFCSWVCPFGLLTEYLNRLHKLIFRKNIQVPALLDYPLRSLKYLLLAFFLWAIVLNMNAAALEYFIYSPYNMVADIKMLYFFADITPFAFWVLVALVVLSIVLRNFWCRYLCPYGALLGILSFISILKVHRNTDTCTNCQKCTRTCPVDIKVHKTARVISDECHACLQCVTVCPEKDTLYLSAARRNAILKPLAYAVIVCLLFVGGSLVGRLTGNWQTVISNNEYLFHVQNLDMPFYQHNRGRVPDYDQAAWLRMMKRIRAAQKPRPRTR
ncbi:MAG: 4Fe-4S binding protein [Deltaproteobacteria bacterium]|jgi:polyferredoxin|nr:4Fe-4S binding protein [Deltaproteobacteria bacterium]